MEISILSNNELKQLENHSGGNSQKCDGSWCEAERFENN
jgi:hypothetical protein